MAYPFPRCAVPPAAAGGQAGSSQPWFPPPACGAWQPPAAPPFVQAAPPFSWDAQPEVGPAEEVADEDVECNEDVIASFVRMEMRMASRGAGRRRRLPPGIARPPPDRTVALPQQEDEASRSALAERAQRRQLEERLYGPHAPEVRALEASLNAAFDRISQAEAPALWPSAPLRGT